MQKNYNVTGEQREQMVQVIGKVMGMQPVYTRMPECAYVISNIKVSKTGEMIWDERTDAEQIAAVTEALARAGFTGTDPELESESQHPIEGLTFSFPREDFSEDVLRNLKALIASKWTLIKKALQAETLEIEMDDEKVSFPWWGEVRTPEQISAYGEFLAALVKMAKEAKRVTAKERETESEKYTFRTFLLRLGFIGAGHKQTRAILMEHLSGHAAFKSQADADAFYAKLKAKRVSKAGAEPDAGEAEETVEDQGEEAGTEVAE